MGEFPEGTARRLVLVHGFTQTARCWGAFGDDLATDHEIIALDAPGHGGSRDVRGGLWETAEGVVTVGGRATYIGYSMGARMVLHCALRHPDQVEGLVLISGTPGIEDDTERAARRASDEALAARIEDVGVAAFLDEWLSQPLFAHLPRELHDIEERRRNTAAGLASALRALGTGAQEPLWGRLVELRMPVLLITGSEDRRYGEIASRAAAAIGTNASHMTLSGGHSVHREDPGAAATVRRWISDAAIRA